MIDIYSPLFIILLFLVSGFTLLFFKDKLYKKVIVLLLISLSSIVYYRSVNSRAGSPLVLPKLNKEEIKLISYYVDLRSEKIFIWVKSKKYPESFVFKYSKESEKKLKEAMKKSKGKPTSIKIDSKGGKSDIFNRFNSFSESSNIIIEFTPSRFNKD